MKSVTSEVRVQTAADGTLTLGLVADTHSHPHEQGLRHLAARAPGAILHAGDIGDLSVLARLAAVAPVHAVRGNIDGPAAAPDWLVVELARGDEVLLRLLLTHVALAGPRIRGEAAKVARARRAPLIVCGHSHVPFLGQERGLTVFNPGALGPRRFQLPVLFGVLRLGARGVELEHVDCETGARWLPP